MDELYETARLLKRHLWAVTRFPIQGNQLVFGGQGMSQKVHHRPLDIGAPGERVGPQSSPMLSPCRTFAYSRVEAWSMPLACDCAHSRTTLEKTC